MLLGEEDPPLPPWQEVTEFCAVLGEYVRTADLVYSPLLKRLAPIVNMQEVSLPFSNPKAKKNADYDYYHHSGQQPDITQYCPIDVKESNYVL